MKGETGDDDQRTMIEYNTIKRMPIDPVMNPDYVDSVMQ